MSATFRDTLAAHLKARPAVWIDGRELAQIAGAYAWRTRLSECRRQLGMTIENRQRRLVQRSGLTYVVSEYRYVPAPTVQSTATSDNQLLIVSAGAGYLFNLAPKS